MDAAIGNPTSHWLITVRFGGRLCPWGRPFEATEADANGRYLQTVNSVRAAYRSQNPTVSLWCLAQERKVNDA